MPAAPKRHLIMVVMMVVMVVMVITPDRPDHPHSAAPDIAVLQIPAAAVMMMVVVVVMMVSVWAARIILCVEEHCRHILVRSIVSSEAAHGVGNRLQQVRIGGGCRNRIR